MAQLIGPHHHHQQQHQDTAKVISLFASIPTYFCR